MSNQRIREVNYAHYKDVMAHRATIEVDYYIAKRYDDIDGGKIKIPTDSG